MMVKELLCLLNEVSILFKDQVQAAELNGEGWQENKGVKCNNNFPGSRRIIPLEKILRS